MTPEELEVLGLAVESALRERWPHALLGPLGDLAGGRSGVTLIGALSGVEVDGLALESTVIKAAPFGRPASGRHDILRQARAITAVAGVPGVAVPVVLATGTDPVQFCAMTRGRGECVEPVLDAAETSLTAGLVRDRAIAAARMLAALHRITDIPAPPDAREEPESDLPAEVDRWRRTAESADPDVLVGGSDLARMLAETIPSTRGPAVLVHGDYRLGNIVFDGPRPTALIDWEIWGRSVPGVDLGWFLVFCDAALFPGIGMPVAGMPTATELLGHYLDAGGRPIENLAWFEAFGRFKMAAIMAHNLRRHREGRHLDPFQEKLPPAIGRLVETGITKLAG